MKCRRVVSVQTSFYFIFLFTFRTVLPYTTITTVYYHAGYILFIIRIRAGGGVITSILALLRTLDFLVNLPFNSIYFLVVTLIFSVVRRMFFISVVFYITLKLVFGLAVLCAVGFPHRRLFVLKESAKVTALITVSHAIIIAVNSSGIWDEYYFVLFITPILVSLMTVTSIVVGRTLRIVFLEPFPLELLSE